MTTIAYDGTTLAADKKELSGYSINPCKKLVWIKTSDGDDVCLAGCGYSEAMQVYKEYLEGTRKKMKFPSHMHADILVYNKTQSTLKVFYSQSQTLFDVEYYPFGMGSGGDVARGAMMAGQNAVEAVKIAAKVDAYTGIGIDSTPVKLTAKLKRYK